LLFSILSQINWVDIAVISLFIRILYVAAKNGFIIELFKLIGVVVTIYISLHYYSALAGLLIKRTGVQQYPVVFVEYFIFLLLVLGTYGFFILLRTLFFNFVKMEAIPALSKWGGFVLGFFRAFLASSLVVCVLALSTIPYFSGSAAKSYWGESLYNTAVSTYSFFWNGVMSKFMVHEKFNEDILEVKTFSAKRDSR